MISRALRYVILPFYIISCATINTSRIAENTQSQEIRRLSGKELSQKVRDLAAAKSSPYTQYQARYLLAMSLRSSDTMKSCSEFTQLSQDNAFWAKPLAMLRMYEVCPSGTLSATDIDNIKSVPWYKYEFLKSATYLAIRSQDLEKEMRFGFDYAELQSRKKEKIALLQRSIEIAKKIGSHAEEVLYLESLYRAAPRFRPSPATSDFMLVADDYKNARDFSNARKYYEAIATNKSFGFDDRYKAIDGLSKCYKIQGLKTEYLKALDRQARFAKTFWRLTPKSQMLMRKTEEAYISLARAQWTEQQTTLAQKTLNDLEALLKGKAGLDQIFWVRGRIEEEAGNLEKSLHWMEQALLQNGLEDTLKETILWQKAWLLRKLQKPAEARDAFKSLKDIALTPFTKTKYSFWYSQTLKESGDTNTAKSELESLIKTDPFGYYSLVAHKILNRRLKLANFISTPTKSDLLIQFDDTLFNWLIDVNEVEIARSLLESFLNTNPNQSTAQLGSMALAGLYNRMYTELGTMEFEARNKFIQEHIDFFFPRSYKSDYDLASKQTNVDQNLLMAITRQESGFDPYSRSPADAFGLMQLLPEVGAAYAKKLNLNYNTAEDLYNPSLNITIGAHLILNQLDKFNGAFIPSVASYNASESAVRGWIKTRYKGDPLSFVEEIPYEETKAYVKLVMRNNIFYQLLNSSSGEIEFPETLLTVEAL